MITGERDLKNLLIYYYNIIGKLLLLSRFFTSEILTACSLLMGHLSPFTPSPLSLFLPLNPWGGCMYVFRASQTILLSLQGAAEHLD